VRFLSMTIVDDDHFLSMTISMTIVLRG